MQTVRSISQIDCFRIHLFLALALDAQKVRKICLKNNLIDKKSLTYENGFDIIHKEAHKEFSQVTKSLDSYFNNLFSSEIEEFDELNGDLRKIKKLICKNKSIHWMLAMIWVLLTDSNMEVKQLGHTWSIYIFLKMIQGYKNQRDVCSIDQRKCEKYEQQLVVEKEKCKILKRELKQVKSSISDLTLENKQLIEENKLLKESSSAYEKKDNEGDVSERDFRRLQYKLDQLEKENQYYKLLVSKREEKEGCNSFIKESCCSKGIKSDHFSNTFDIDEKCLESIDSNHLCQRKVAIVGGIERLKPRYKEVIEGHGGCFFFHNGVCKRGVSTLRNVVKCSDTVIFITTVNSHCALNIVKDLCKKSEKDFKIMRQPSVRALKQTIAAI